MAWNDQPEKNSFKWSFPLTFRSIFFPQDVSTWTFDEAFVQPTDDAAFGPAELLRRLRDAGAWEEGFFMGNNGETWKSFSRWWFQIFFIFTPKIGEDSNFD